MSCYALFQGWLLLRQPPGCLHTRTSFPTQPRLQDLSRGSGLFPFRRRNSSPDAQLPGFPAGIRSLPGFGKLTPPSPSSALPPAVIAERSPSSDFGENKLSPGSFGISPLTTPHPNGLQSKWVRASRPCHRTFTLDMVSSPGFVSNRCHFAPSSDSLSLRLRVSLPSASHTD